MSEDNTLPVFPEIPEANHPAGVEMIEWIFTNDKTNPHTRLLFHGLYNGAFANKLGIMQARRKGKEEIDTLIVGVELTEDGPACYPLARVLTPDELAEFETPDGNGNYV